MTGPRDRPPDDLPDRHDDEAPEALNREQTDEGQAQDWAEAVRNPGPVLSDSRKAPGDPADLIPDDTPDLIDRMTEMVRSGRIDSDAYLGEPMHDDEEDILGDTDPGDEIDHLPELDEPLSDLDSDWGEDDLDAFPER